MCEQGTISLITLQLSGWLVTCQLTSVLVTVRVSDGRTVYTLLSPGTELVSVD